MKNIFVVLIILYACAYSVSTETCKSTNPGGAACLTAADLPSWMTSYSGGDTCFSRNGANVSNPIILFCIIKHYCCFINYYKIMFFLCVCSGASSTQVEIWSHANVLMTAWYAKIDVHR